MTSDDGMGPCGCVICETCPNLAPLDEGSADLCEDCLRKHRTMSVELISGQLLHRAWLKSGRKDPLWDADAWDGFALTVQALAEVEGLTR